MEPKPNLERGIYRVRFMELRHKNGDPYYTAFEGDMIFLEGDPWLVFDWAHGKHREEPLVKVRLDRAELEPSIPHDQVQIYRVPVVNPKKVH